MPQIENDDDETLETSATIEDYSEEIDELRPEIDSLTDELKKLEKVMGSGYALTFFKRAISPTLLGFSGMAITMAIAIALPELGIPMGLLGGMSVLGGGAHAYGAIRRKENNEIERSEKVTKELKVKSEELRSLINSARKLVEDELITGGATKDRRGRLTATKEQVELARKEMDDDLSGRDKSE